jgi:hypothetical protein
VITADAGDGMELPRAGFLNLLSPVLKKRTTLGFDP